MPVQVSQKLQDQIHFLCKEVWNDEWSGMLFYETEGEFGQDNFKIVANELFPLDIGTQTYTEYQTSDPELIKFLMANPEARGMKKGHIHSHNNMGVFFSNTDNEELGDNCGFHNFYLSLIVNNKNDMCAKIAFKAKIKSVVNSTLTYKNQDGKDTDKTMTSEKETESILVYKCKVSVPQGGVVEDTFKSRFQELRTIKKKKEEDKKASDAANKQKQEGKGLAGGRNWEQGGLFDDVKGKTSYSIPKEDSYKSRGLGVVGSVNKSSTRVYSMLARIIAQDPSYEGSIGSILEKIDDQFYDFDGIIASKAEAASTYFEDIERNALDFYIDAFPEDRNLLAFEGTMEECVEILERCHDTRFPELVTHLSEALTLEIR